MFPNVEAEIARKRLTKLMLSEKTGIRYQTLTAKLSGDSPVTIRDAKAIKAALETDLPIEILFEEVS